MDHATGLSRLEAQVSSDLNRISWPSGAWVKPRTSPNGGTMLNVLIIGAGQGGLTLGFQLGLEQVDRIAILDRTAPESRGPWRTYGRMITLRSPKQTTGPDMGVPSLTFQSWYEAQYGAAAWDGLGKIPKELWADYLAWYERVLRLPVRFPAEVLGLHPGADHVAVEIRTPEGTEILHARHVVIATGIESTGRWLMPTFVRNLPQSRRNHTGDMIDFDALRGRRVAVLGAGASAFDNAATALEAGAAQVDVFWRRDEIQRIQPYKCVSFNGFLRHLGDLDDQRRWQMMRYFLNLRESFPAETWARVTCHPNATLHGGCDWTGAALREDGVIQLETVKGPFLADHIVVGTGFDVDLDQCPLLGPLSASIARWSDRYQPPPEETDQRLGKYPYLGSTFELVRRPSAIMPSLSRIRLFTFGATMSFGPSGSSINALKFAAARLVHGITRDIFSEDAEAHFDDLLAYDTPEF